jgi:hypothetical protein
MAILDVIGAAVVTGGQVSAGLGTFTNWTVEKCTTGDVNVDSEDIDDEDGKLMARLIFKKHAKIALSLISKVAGGTAAQALADFPKGNMCTITGLTTYYVEDCSIESSKSAVRVSATLALIGIT